MKWKRIIVFSYERGVLNTLVVPTEVALSLADGIPYGKHIPV